MDNTYNTYTFGTQPLHFTRVVVARNESILIEVRTLSSFSITSRWERSLCAHSSLGLLVFVMVYYNELVPYTRLPSRRPVKLPSGPLQEVQDLLQRLITVLLGTEDNQLRQHP
jgi:isopentenyldiphosphate isomerase